MPETFGCGDVTRRLAEYLDDALPLVERQGIEAHLASCADCAAALRSLRSTTELLGRLPREPMPRPLKERLLEALRSLRRPPLD